MKSLAALAVVAATLVPAVAQADHASFGTAPRRVATAMVMPAEDPSAPAPAPVALGTETDRAPRRTTIFGLPRNVGPGDRVLRTIVGLGLAGVGAYGLATDDLSATTSGILIGVSAVPFATAATGYCPLYQLVGIDRSF